MRTLEGDSERAEPERIGMVEGDRACHVCGFNLRGQPVVRERYYQMVMVRCPECGAPAPLLEYPPVSRWITRARVVAMIACLVLMLSGFLFAGLLIWQNAVRATRLTVEPLATLIANDFIEFAKPNGGNTINAWLGQQSPGPETRIENSWLKKQNPSEWLSRVEVATQPLAPSVVGTWLAAAPTLFSVGCVLACMLPHWRRRRLMLVPVIAFTVAMAAIALGWPDTKPRFISAWEVAVRILPWWIMVAQCGVGAMIVLCGVMSGRPIARLLIRWLVPPRQYPAFGFLWAADARPMPTARLAAARRTPHAAARP